MWDPRVLSHGRLCLSAGLHYMVGQGLEGRAAPGNCFPLHPVQCTAQLGPRVVPGAPEEPLLHCLALLICVYVSMGLGALRSVAGSGQGRAWCGFRTAKLRGAEEGPSGRADGPGLQGGPGADAGRGGWG